MAFLTGKRRLAAEARMGANIRFEPEGVRCTLRLPLLLVDSLSKMV
jgi:hypothetical protein